jgi:hypothetical protein
MPRRPTRRTNRSIASDLDRRLNDLEGDDATPSVQTVLWASLKDYYGADLTSEERRALAAAGGQK